VLKLIGSVKFTAPVITDLERFYNGAGGLY